MAKKPVFIETFLKELALQEAVASVRLDKGADGTQTVCDQPPYVLMSEQRLKMLQRKIEEQAQEIARLRDRGPG